MSVKLILSDLDGTLLSTGQVAISNRNMQALEAAYAQGVCVVPCTGRVYDMLPPQLLSADFVRYVVSSHGARLYDAKTGETLYDKLLTPEESYRVLKVFEKKNIYAEIAANGTIYVEKHLDEHLMEYPVPIHHYWYMRDKRYTAVDNIADYFLANRIGIEKVNLYGIPEALREEIYNGINELGCVRFTKKGINPDMEFYHKDLDKMAAVNRLLEVLGVSMADAFAIGDSMTDYDIVKNAAVGVAMGNAIDAVKEVAKYITDTNINGGVGAAVEQYILNAKKEATVAPADISSYQKKNNWLVCIDSDGCAMDTMEIKHKECFATAFIECFGLQGIAKYAREAWDYTNLYSKTRGFYRMKTLVSSMELLAARPEVQKRGFKIPDMTPMKEWMKACPVQSDATLKAYNEEHPNPLFDTVLAWSKEVNARVKRVVHDVPPFPFVKESLQKLFGKADIAVVSATPTAALQKEWSEHGVIGYTSFVAGQEYGAKKDVIAKLGAEYDKSRILMIGDALGDYQAAQGAGAWFYPICPNEEDLSWEEFYNKASDLFLSDAYTEEVQKEYLDRLDSLLPDKPFWEK